MIRYVEDPFRIVRFLGLKARKAKVVADTGDTLPGSWGRQMKIAQKSEF